MREGLRYELAEGLELGVWGLGCRVLGCRDGY